MISTCLRYADIFLNLLILSKNIIDTGLKNFTKTALAQCTILATAASLVTVARLYQVKARQFLPENRS